jgi:proteic killer suppression protein
VIKSFRHRGAERFFHTGSKAGIQVRHADRLRLQLFALDNAKHPTDMNAPGWKLHRLTGTLKGHWAVSLSGNWRLTFRFEGEDATLVDYQDYHWKESSMSMHNPPHPGFVLREYLGDTSVSKAAAHLRITRVTLSRLLNGKAGISAIMAIRLADALGTSPELWMNMQSQYDLWRARQTRQPMVRPFPHVTPSRRTN